MISKRTQELAIEALSAMASRLATTLSHGQLETLEDVARKRIAEIRAALHEMIELEDVNDVNQQG